MRISSLDVRLIFFCVAFRSEMVNKNLVAAANGRRNRLQ